MTSPVKELYSAACNPPRRAKRTRADTIRSPSPEIAPSGMSSLITTHQQRPILPKRASASGKSGTNDDNFSTNTIRVSPVMGDEQSSVQSTPSLIVGNPPAKRGRKPGPLSRSAREAQRRLNHSVIEKARRTKINNALATLKQLVPLDYGKKAKTTQDDENNDDEDYDDGDEEYGSTKKRKTTGTGKKEEKEKEYKLEILVRTVAFMEDLLRRVSVLEDNEKMCSKCGGQVHEHPTYLTLESQSRPNPDQREYESDMIQSTKRPRTEQENAPDTSFPSPEPSPSRLGQDSLLKQRLPPISSWLPETLLDPSIYILKSPIYGNQSAPKEIVPPLQLPSPPSPTRRFSRPSIHNASPPSLTPTSFNTNQGFVLQDKKSFSPTRTPEDENAATMLLKISGITNSSPTFRPLPPSMISYTTSGETICQSYSSPHYNPAERSSTTKVNEGQNQIRGYGGSGELLVQTPSSVLGLVTPPLNGVP